MSRELESIIKFTEEDQKELDRLQMLAGRLIEKKRNWQRYQSDNNPGWTANPDSKLKSYFR